MNVNKDKDYLKKKNYGKVPRFVEKIKKEIEDEYQLVREMQIEEQEEQDRRKYRRPFLIFARFLLSDEERNELISALKKKWEVVHQEF